MLLLPNLCLPLWGGRTEGPGGSGAAPPPRCFAATLPTRGRVDMN